MDTKMSVDTTNGYPPEVHEYENLPAENHLEQSNDDCQDTRIFAPVCVPQAFDIGTEIKTETLHLDDIEDSEYKRNLEASSPPDEFNGDNLGIMFTEKKHFTCAFCFYKTKYKYNLIRHVKSHDKFPPEKASYKCDKCPFETEHNYYLQRHLRVHSNTSYKCEQCDFVTKYKESLSKHMLRHKSPSQCKMYICDECEYESKDKLSLKRHMLTHKRLEEVEHFKCMHCSFVTKHQLSFNNHMLRIHNKDKIDKYKCPECDFGTYHKISLKNHILTHRKPGEVPMYKCPECPYETKTKQSLPNHMKRHLDMVPCPKCQKMICQRGMPLHLKSHESGDAKKRYKCSQCDYGTLYYGNLSRHIKIMHSNKEDIDYKRCPECPFKTFENARLKRHIKEIHSEEAPQFKCDHCDFTSKFNSCLKRHVETAHINTDPVECPVCKKQSANIYTLRIHMKLHRKEDEIKMFKCAECKFKTRHSGAYKEHVLKHKSIDEVTHYKCLNCSFRTRNKKRMKEHITKYVDTSKLENGVACTLCCFRTSQERILRIHKGKKHKNDLDPNEFLYCSYCAFKTLSKKALNMHVKNHKKNKLNIKGTVTSDDSLHEYTSMEDGIDNVSPNISVEASEIESSGPYIKEEEAADNSLCDSNREDNGSTVPTIIAELSSVSEAACMFPSEVAVS